MNETGEWTVRPLIEFCASNMSTEVIMAKLEANPDYDVIEYGCLGHCGECYMFPYALVDGEFIDAETPEELYEKIVAKIEHQSNFFSFLDEE